MNSKKRSYVSKDEFLLWIGLFVLVLSSKLFVEIDLQGRGVKTKSLVENSQSGITTSKNYKSLCCISLLIQFMFACQTLFLLNNNKYYTNNF
jgi:hypothetical protein